MMVDPTTLATRLTRAGLETFLAERAARTEADFAKRSPFETSARPAARPLGPDTEFPLVPAPRDPKDHRYVVGRAGR